ncbi:MAG: GDP-L-fucose synthase [Treponema sp.]|uniref:GDP-L-fucose synthase family protein n=1 Tax=Treponema sp. TaxID=166 RepID=UPI00298DCE38|nr:GDP-L-fucose synthase [Treponema sp.]MCQ2600282.1 GDP-L-fucose synthase [Treponema sp.]
MKILVTGSSGLVGHNVIENPEISTNELLTPHSKELDLLDYLAVKNYITSNKPDLIIHCAGKVGGIQANMKDMYGFYTENAVMGMNLVRAAKECGVKKFINLSSSCTYPRDYINPLKEEYTLKAELEPTNEGYALAKLSILKMCEYISKEYEGFEYKTLIPCNLYGKYDKFGEKNAHMIPSIIRKIDHAKKTGQDSVDIWGDGEARREFMYAGDLADCISYVISNWEKVPVLMNVGLGYDYSVNEYYESIKKIIGYDGQFTHDLTKPVGMKQKLLDVTRAKNIGWTAKTSLEDGVRQTYMYYLESINE